MTPSSPVRDFALEVIDGIALIDYSYSNRIGALAYQGVDQGTQQTLLDALFAVTAPTQHLAIHYGLDAASGLASDLGALVTFVAESVDSTGVLATLPFALLDPHI